MDDKNDVLLVTTIDAATHQTYKDLASSLQTTTPALAGHILSGIAPALAEATQERARDPDGRWATGLQLHATLLRGEMTVGRGARCDLAAEAMRMYERVAATVSNAAALLERAGYSCTAAQAAVERAQERRARTRTSSAHKNVERALCARSTALRKRETIDCISPCRFTAPAK